MTHGDDDGLRIPPRIASKQIVIIPFLTKPELEDKILSYCESLANDLRKIDYHGYPLQVIVDKKDIRGGEKNWNWIKKGIPLRIEVGPRDIEADNIGFARRDKSHKEKNSMDRIDFLQNVTQLLDDIQDNYYKDATQLLHNHSVRDIQDFESFQQFFTPKNLEKPEIHGGFVLAKWCENSACEEKLTDLKVSIRCLPLAQSGTSGHCVICGSKATTDAVYAKSY